MSYGFLFLSKKTENAINLDEEVVLWIAYQTISIY